jgi:transcriptional regulator with PAS, ATPase and Fis domain
MVRPSDPSPSLSALNTSSASMSKVMDQLLLAARSEAPVMLRSEIGAEVALLARFLHDSSPRRDGPFLALSCPSMSDLSPRGLAGIRGGSLFLDEIGALAPPLQTRLLRLLDDRSPREEATRVLSATRHDLVGDLEAGRFREDLFYRLSVVELRVPPLRERTEDILPLARTLITSMSAELGRRVPALSASAAALLLEYSWPANLRELENVIERVLLIHPTDVITAEALLEMGVGDVRRPRVGDDITLRRLEREHFRHVLARAGDLNAAAAILGVSKSTLRRRRVK